MNSTASLESSEIFSKFKQHKAEFQRMKREKQKEHFTSKNIYDFKNNKLFWDHYSPFIKIKSDKTVDFSPTVFFHDERELDDPEEIGQIFNTFFTNLSSTSLSSDKESERYIDQIFTKLKREEKIKINKEPFKFVHVNQNIVERLIHNLNSTSGAGFSEIPSKVFLKGIPLVNLN